MSDQETGPDTSSSRRTRRSDALAISLANNGPLTFAFSSGPHQSQYWTGAASRSSGSSSSAPISPQNASS
ncbi:hypothetical protein [Kribbella endophytica]